MKNQIEKFIDNQTNRKIKLKFELNFNNKKVKQLWDNIKVFCKIN